MQCAHFSQWLHLDMSNWAAHRPQSVQRIIVFFRLKFIDLFNYNLNALGVGQRRCGQDVMQRFSSCCSEQQSRKANGDWVFFLFHLKPVKGNYQINYASFMSLLIGKFIKISFRVSTRSSRNWFRSQIPHKHTHTHTQQSRVLDAWVQCIALRVVYVVRLQSSLIVKFI